MGRRNEEAEEPVAERLGVGCEDAQRGEEEESEGCEESIKCYGERKEGAEG